MYADTLILQIDSQFVTHSNALTHKLYLLNPMEMNILCSWLVRKIHVALYSEVEQA